MKNIGQGLLRGLGFAVVAILVSQVVGWFFRRSVSDSLRQQVQASLDAKRVTDPTSSGFSPTPGRSIFRPAPAPTPAPVVVDAQLAERTGALTLCSVAYDILKNNSGDATARQTATKRVEAFRATAATHMLAATGEEPDGSTLEGAVKSSYQALRDNPAARAGIYGLCEAWTNRLAGLPAQVGNEFSGAINRRDTPELRRLISRHLPEPTADELAAARQELVQSNFDEVMTEAYNTWAQRGYNMP